MLLQFLEKRSKKREKRLFEFDLHLYTRDPPLATRNTAIVFLSRPGARFH